jgi:hypothetical protein
MLGFAASIACEAISPRRGIASTSKERWSRNDGFFQ